MGDLDGKLQHIFVISLDCVTAQTRGNSQPNLEARDDVVEDLERMIFINYCR